VTRETVEAAVIAGRDQLAPEKGVRYYGFIDAAGGSGQDSMSLAVAHRVVSGDDVRYVLDYATETRPPFSPADCAAEFAAVLLAYKVTTVSGDRWAGEWPREPLLKAGIRYQVADKSKSDIYRDFLPLLNSKRVDLLDDETLVEQLCGLERRTSSAGKDTIDHAKHSNAHDDLANACAGAIASAAVARKVRVAVPWLVVGEQETPFWAMPEAA
jgi:hypothetical protein